MRSTIDTGRLSLVSITPDQLDGLVNGCTNLDGTAIPSRWLADNPAERDMVLFFAQRIREEPELAPWSFRLIVLRESATMIGHVGFHDLPIDGCLELGYTVLLPHRRCGYASEAVRALMDAAARDHGIHRFRLAISPTNGPSLAMADRLGFRHAGEQLDNVDGLELLYECSWP